MHGMQIQDPIRAVGSPGHDLEVNLVLPKLKIEYKYNRVQVTLQELGVQKIFVPGGGDFGNLFKNVRPGGVSPLTLFRRSGISEGPGTRDDGIRFDSISDIVDLISQMERGPHVSAIIHKAVIEVDERGTAASRGTVLIDKFSMLIPCHFVKLDRPFCFLIMSSSNTVCFAGICADPQAAE